MHTRLFSYPMASTMPSKTHMTPQNHFGGQATPTVHLVTDKQTLLNDIQPFLRNKSPRGFQHFNFERLAQKIEASQPNHFVYMTKENAHVTGASIIMKTDATLQNKTGQSAKTPISLIGTLKHNSLRNFEALLNEALTDPNTVYITRCAPHELSVEEPELIKRGFRRIESKTGEPDNRTVFIKGGSPDITALKGIDISPAR